MRSINFKQVCTPGGTRTPWRAVAILLALSLLAGCAGIPDTELNAYISSVGEAKQAGRAMIADWRSARAESDRRAAPVPAPTVAASPIPLQLPAQLGGTLSAEDARVQAWEAIALYTEALARLQAGESVDEVKKTTGRLLQLAMSIGRIAAPGLAELGTLLQEAAGAMEKARLAAEFKKAVQDGVPIVRRIINEVLLKDTESHYTLRMTLANEDYARVEIDDQADDDQKQLRKARIVDESKALTASIIAYRGLLQQTDRSLDALEKAVNRPVDLAEQADQLMDIALELKRHWSAYENARLEGRN